VRGGEGREKIEGGGGGKEGEGRGANFYLACVLIITELVKVSWLFHN